jgi:cob(I)alamin adenosyltransferase
MNRSRIYTRTGDAGKTGLANGERIEKSSQRIAAIGAVDELNAALGLVTATLENSGEIGDCILDIQNRLFVIGALLAGADGIELPEEAVADLERCIDRFDAELPTMTHFILPGGSPAGAQLHLARTICRRAEREVLQIETPDRVESPVCVYLNRLSDLLFVLARLVNSQAGVKEHRWIP